MVGQGCGACTRDEKTHRNTEQTVFSQTDLFFLSLEVKKAKQHLFNANNAFLSVHLWHSESVVIQAEKCVTGPGVKRHL